MINNNNIYKLIKKAKDENLNSSAPISKIIQHPITFIYSFTLNAQNEPILEENAEIPFQSIINQNNKKDNNIKTESKIDKNKIIDIENNNNDKFRKIEKEKTFLNKKRELENNQKNNSKKNIQSNNNNPSKIVKNKIIHQIYNSKNINLWENESSEEKNDNILPIHKQIEFIDKSKEEFSKYKVEKKSEYDKDLDKGRLKKIHKNKISFKKHKNYFQKISNKQLKKQFKYNNNNINKNK
mgnify:CR=1 FL=1